MTEKVRIVKTARQKCPLYKRYPGQLSPQPAHLVLDPEEKEAVFEVDTAHPSTPARFWHGRMIRWPVNPRVKWSVLHKLEENEKLLNLLGVVADGHTVTWDGSNHVGRLNETAMEAAEEVERILWEVGENERNLYGLTECER